MTSGDKVKINFGTHKGRTGTIIGISRRGKAPDLISVSVRGVQRELLFWPGDLAAA